MKLLKITALALLLHIPTIQALDDCQRTIAGNTILTTMLAGAGGYWVAKIADWDEPTSTRIKQTVAVTIPLAAVIACFAYVTMEYDCNPNSLLSNHNQ
jgi:hypothetical protein